MPLTLTSRGLFRCKSSASVVGVLPFYVIRCQYAYRMFSRLEPKTEKTVLPSPVKLVGWQRNYSPGSKPCFPEYFPRFGQFGPALSSFFLTRETQPIIFSGVLKEKKRWFLTFFCGG